MCATRILSALLMLTTAAWPHATCAAQSRTCTIAGDVGAPDAYTFSQGESADLIGLLAKAGASAEKGSAVVVRGASMQILSTSTNQHTPTALQDGDIVVFRRLEQRFSGNLHAVVVVDGKPGILPLVGGSPTLGELLASVNLGGGQSVVGIRSDWSTSDRRAFTENDTIQHGDVLVLEKSAPVSGYRSTETFASLSIPAAPASSDNVPYVDSGSEPSDQQFGLDSVSPASSGLIVPPVSQSVTLYVPESSDASAEATIATGPAVSDVDSIDQMELRDPAASPVAVSPDIADVQDTVFHTASLESRRNDVETIELGDSYSSASADSSSNAMWNAVFVVGLLFAMGLIVVGWLKTRQEREMELQMADTMRLTPTTEDSDAPETAEQGQPVADVELSEAPEVPAIEEPTTNTAEISEDCPILSAGIEDRWEEQNESNLETVAESVEVESVQSEAGEWFAADWQESETGKAAAEVEPANGGDILEELIQNRLPIQLQQAELPLQIALFGEPAGPQRLRVDAAHTKLAAPHMAKVARRSKRKMPVAAVETTAGNEAKTRAAEKTVRAPAAQNDDGSRFDHALNFHEEQSDK